MRLLAHVLAAAALATALAGSARATCPEGTHPVIGPVRCTPSGCTGGSVRCAAGRNRTRRAEYDHVEQKLWDWIPVNVANIDLRSA